MKYLVCFMVVVLFLTYPLSLFGVSVSPSFSHTLSDIGGTLSFLDDPFTKYLLKQFTFIVDKDNSDYEGSCFEFDSKDSDDMSLRELSEFKNVHYIVRFPYVPSDKIGVIDATASVIRSLFADVAGTDKSLIFDFRNTYLGFDSYGSLVCLYFIFNNKIYYSSKLMENSTNGFSDAFYSFNVSFADVSVSYYLDLLVYKYQKTFNYTISTIPNGSISDFYHGAR